MRVATHVVRTVLFVGEQDGVPEREFKGQVMTLLKAHPGIERAYLARVAYEASSQSVALCLVAERGHEVLLHRIGAIFASMFGRDQHLDIIWVDRNQEEDLAQVCAPFFEAKR